MPKMTTPHGASWRGRTLAPGETIEVGDADAFQLAAHGFVLVEAPIDPARDVAAILATSLTPNTNAQAARATNR